MKFVPQPAIDTRKQNMLRDAGKADSDMFLLFCFLSCLGRGFYTLDHRYFKPVPRAREYSRHLFLSS